MESKSIHTLLGSVDAKVDALIELYLASVKRVNELEEQIKNLKTSESNHVELTQSKDRKTIEVIEKRIDQLVAELDKVIEKI